MEETINNLRLIQAIRASQQRMNLGRKAKRKREMLAQTLSYYFAKISGNVAGNAPEYL